MRSDTSREDDDRDRLEDRPEPTLAQRLLSDTRHAWIWLPVRLYLSVAWFGAAVALLESQVRLMTGPARVTLSFVDDGADRISPVLLALVVGGDGAIGLLLASGAYVGATAFLSLVLSWNPVAAGPPALDPLATGLTMLSILGWRVAGWYGVDRWLLFDRDLPAWLRTRQVSFRKVLDGEDRTVRRGVAWVGAKAHAAGTGVLPALARGWKDVRLRWHR